MLIRLSGIGHSREYVSASLRTTENVLCEQHKLLAMAIYVILPKKKILQEAGQVVVPSVRAWGVV